MKINYTTRKAPIIEVGAWVLGRDIDGKTSLGAAFWNELEYKEVAQRIIKIEPGKIWLEAWNPQGLSALRWFHNIREVMFIPVLYGDPKYSYNED